MMPGRLFISIFLLFLLTIPAGCRNSTPRLHSGDPAPGFSLPVLDEKRIVTFPTDLMGKVTAIRFWADWCPYCDHEMRDLEPVFRKYHDRGLEILAINVHQDAPTAARFVQRLGISYQVLLDQQGKTAAAYQVIGLPTTYIVDRKGVISTKIVGESSAELFVQLIEKLL